MTSNAAIEPGSLASLVEVVDGAVSFRGVDLKAETAVLKSGLPDTPLLKVLDDGVVFIGLTNTSSAMNTCEITYRNGHLTGTDTDRQKTLFNIPVAEADGDVIVNAMHENAIVVCEASDRGMIVYSRVKIAS